MSFEEELVGKMWMTGFCIEQTLLLFAKKNKGFKLIYNAGPSFWSQTLTNV